MHSVSERRRPSVRENSVAAASDASSIQLAVVRLSRSLDHFVVVVCRPLLPCHSSATFTGCSKVARTDITHSVVLLHPRSANESDETIFRPTRGLTTKQVEQASVLLSASAQSLRPGYAGEPVRSLVTMTAFARFLRSLLLNRIGALARSLFGVSC